MHASHAPHEHPGTTATPGSDEMCDHERQDQALAELSIVVAALLGSLALVVPLVAQSLPTFTSAALFSWHPPPLSQPPRL